MDFGVVFLAANKNGIERVTALSSSWRKIAESKAFQGIFNYASKVYSTNKKTGEAIKDNLERYLTELQRTADTLKSYQGDKEKQAKSILWAEVNLGFMACERWMAAIQQNKVPRDLEESLVRKTGRLQTKIALESVDQLNEANQRFEKALAEAKASGDAKHPLLYYAKGKELFNNLLWYDAKQQFLNYEVLLDGGDKRCRKPQEDNCYYYLSYIEEQMRLQNINAETNPILSRNPMASIVPDKRTNPYEEKYKKWVAKYPPTEDALISRRKGDEKKKEGDKPTTPVKTTPGGHGYSDLVSPTSPDHSPFLTFSPKGGGK